MRIAPIGIVITGSMVGVALWLHFDNLFVGIGGALALFFIDFALLRYLAKNVSEVTSQDKKRADTNDCPPDPSTRGTGPRPRS
jgi:hypothetical protein